MVSYLPFRVLFGCCVCLGILFVHAPCASAPIAKPTTVLRLYYDFDSTVPEAFEKPISAAVRVWAVHLGGTAAPCLHCREPNVVRFRMVRDEHGDKFPFSPATFKVAHVVSSKSAQRVPEVHFNAYRFLDSHEKSPDIYTVALHEIGHVLGLSHSSNPRSVMYPHYQEGGQILSEELESQFMESRFAFPVQECHSPAEILPAFERE